MATVNKDFKIKNRLVVEGDYGTINGNTILTEADGDAYILDLIGGETLVKSVEATQLEVNGAGKLSVKANVFDAYGAAGTAEDNANTYTDTQLNDYTPTASLDTTVALYGYAKTADLPTMYSDADVDNHLSGGDGINYSSGTISADVAGGLHISNQQIQINRNTVDVWYDASGAASTVAGDLTTHISDTSTHGVNGDIVGTSDTQTLSNKDFRGETVFHAGNGAGSLAVDLNSSTGAATITNNNDDLTIATNGGDIVLNASGTAYITSASAGNEIATNSYVDNAVSGLNWKQAVNLLYDDSTPTLSGDSVTTPLVIDQHPALGAGEVGYRILVKNGNDAGIYVYNQTGTSWTLDRAADADTYEELVGAAVFVMEGTQYDQTSWVQSNHYLSAFTGQSWTQFSGSGSVVAGTGITVNGLEVSVDSTIATKTYADDAVTDHNANSGIHGVTGDVVGTSDQQILTNKTIDASSNTLSNIANSSLSNSSIDINGYTTSLGGTVTLDTDDVAEGSAQYFTQARARGSVSAGTGINYDSNTGVIDADLADFDTDDLTEGTGHKYFTDERAQDAVADAIAAGTHSNITITYDDATNKFTFEAENGVADSTTNDLAEGTDNTGAGGGNNLYFTNARAVSALEAVVPNFTAVEVNSLAKQVAATVSAPTSGSAVTAYSFAKADYRSAKFLIKTAYGTHTELTEVLLTLDSSDNIAIVEYAMVGTNGSSMTVTADIDGSNVRLRVTPTNNSSTVTVVGTLLA